MENAIKIVEVKEHEPAEYFVNCLGEKDLEYFNVADSDEEEVRIRIKNLVRRFEEFQRRKSQEMKRCLSCGHKFRKPKTEAKKKK